MRIRTQFLISLAAFSLVIVLIISSITITEANLSNLQRQKNIVQDIESKANSLSFIAVNYFLYHQNLTDWQATVSLIKAELSSVDSNNPQHRATMRHLNLTDISFAEIVSKIQNKTLSVNATGFQTFWSTVAGHVQQLTFDCEQLANQLNKQENNLTITNSLLIVSLILAFGAYFYITYHLFRRTLASINVLKRKTKTISGDNVAEPSTPYQDEVGEVSADVDKMMVNLQQTTISKDRLEQEIAERRKAEIALLEAQNKLKQHAGNLEKMVQERTKAIRESERNYKELYESFGEAFIATDWEFNVIHWNKAAEKVTEIKAKDALGKKIYDVLPEMLSVDITPYFKDLQEKKIVRFMMNTVSRETKKPSIFEISIYPSTLGMIVIVEDKTDEERNRRLSAIGQTASMVGHDIRNPLQSITSSLYLIKEEMKESPECQNNPDLQDSFVMIEENVEYINKIVSDLQDYTRPLTPVKKEVKLLGFLKSILATVKIPESIVSEIIAIEDLVIITDASYLKRALVNLVTNAVQAMPNGGELTISAIGKEDNVLISVKDTGTGISKEAQEKIFTPLFTTKSKGQGLGLAVVKRIVDALKGNITYKSEEGKGTEFIIEIPKR